MTILKLPEFKKPPLGVSPLILGAIMFFSGTGYLAQMAMAQVTMPEPLTQWYEALRKSDAPALESLLGEDATIELSDLGIVQTKSEFLDSLDEWKEANDGAIILTKAEAVADTTATVDVCYSFPSNEMLIREVFTMDGAKITGSIQEQISETCDGF